MSKCVPPREWLGVTGNLSTFNNRLLSSSACSWTVRHVSLFLDPPDEVGPSISSSVVLCFFVRLVCILVLVLVVCLCPPLQKSMQV
jgi:hypothetical protein